MHAGARRNQDSHGAQAEIQTASMRLHPPSLHRDEGGPGNWGPQTVSMKSNAFGLDCHLSTIRELLALCHVKQPDGVERMALFPSNLSLEILKPELPVTFACNKIVSFEIFPARLNT